MREVCRKASNRRQLGARGDWLTLSGQEAAAPARGHEQQAEDYRGDSTARQFPPSSDDPLWSPIIASRRRRTPCEARPSVYRLRIDLVRFAPLPRHRRHLRDMPEVAPFEGRGSFGILGGNRMQARTNESDEPFHLGDVTGDRALF